MVRCKERIMVRPLPQSSQTRIAARCKDDARIHPTKNASNSASESRTTFMNKRFEIMLA
jgi:hypothetical protein